MTSLGHSMIKRLQMTVYVSCVLAVYTENRYSGMVGVTTWNSHISDVTLTLIYRYCNCHNSQRS